MGIQPDSCSDGLSAVNLMKPEIELATSKSNFDVLKGVPVKMSGFVFTFCVFPTSFDACYSGLLPEILQAMLEWPKLGFYPKLCVDLVDLSNREQKRQKAKTDIFTGTPFRWLKVTESVFNEVLICRK